VGTYDTRGGYPLSPPDDGRDPTPLQETVWGLLEDAGLPEPAMEEIDTMVGNAEYARNHPGRRGSELELGVRKALEEAGLGPAAVETIADRVRQAEDDKAERDYDRHQERLMETGGGPTLREYQQAAMKLKRGHA
jgi:hypothetical protein